jgi:hypothetical protein
MRYQSLVLLCAIFSCQIFAATTPFVVNINEASSGEEGRKLIEQLTTALYAPLNITPTFVVVPAERAFLLMEKGEIDAMAIRTEYAMRNAENTIQIKPALVTTHPAIFCSTSAYCNVELDSVLFTIKGDISNAAFCETLTENCFQASNLVSALKAIENRPGYMLLSDPAPVMQTVCASPLRKVYYQNLPNRKIELFHWIHKKHVKLLPHLEAVIARFVAQSKGELALSTLKAIKDSCEAEFIDVSTIRD